MVLESLTDVYNAERHYATLLLHGAGYAILGLLVGLYFFPKYASLIVTFFVAAASIPLLNDMRIYHATHDENYLVGIEKLLLSSGLLFLGASIALTIVYLFVPGEYALNAFRFDGITAGLIWSGEPIAQTILHAAQAFMAILINDIPILLMCVFFAFIGYDNPSRAEKMPVAVTIRAAVNTIFAVAVALAFFREHASMVIVFLASAANIPMLYNLIKYEEDKDWHEQSEMVLIKEHGKAIAAYLWVFAAITVTLTAAYLVLPAELNSSAFSAQLAEFYTINPQAATGQVTGELTGMATATGFFNRIFTNNLAVLAFCVLFSFAYGAGAIFIMTWNGSVIALAAGMLIREKAALITAEGGFGYIASYLGVTSHTIFLRYGIHGLLEIGAYIIAGLAGGIISVAMIKHHYQTKEFEHIITDSGSLLLLAIVTLFLAAVTETWITPLFY